MRRALTWLLAVQHSSAEIRRRGRSTIVLSAGMVLVALLFMPVTLVFQARPGISLASEVLGIGLFSIILLLARAGLVRGAIWMLLCTLVGLPLLVMVSGRFILTAPIALVFSLLISSVLLRPWQIWLMLLADLLGLVLALAWLLWLDYTPSAFEISILLIGSIMLPMVALVSFLGARETERERQALRVEIAERRRVEQALSRAKDAAEAADRAKSAFLANISHELRTPLTSILGYTDLLLLQHEQQGDRDLLDDLTTIHRAGDRLLELINDLLDLTSIEAGTFDLRPTTFQVTPVIRELVSAHGEQIIHRHNAVVLECDADLGAIHTDQAQLRRIVTNLLSNATKFTNHGTITLTARRERDDRAEWICISVADTGIGIAASLLPDIFQDFTRAHDAPTQYDGAGLGLALSRRLCALMGGTITAESALGAGSVFTVRLPTRLDALAPFSDYSQ
jgi:signal transduction histidine kinase